jgi:hypothetical protein
MADIGDPAIALAMDGGLVGAARLQVGPADQPHVGGFRRGADLLLLCNSGGKWVRRDQKTDDEQSLPRHGVLRVWMHGFLRVAHAHPSLARIDARNEPIDVEVDE